VIIESNEFPNCCLKLMIEYKIITSKLSIRDKSNPYPFFTLFEQFISGSNNILNSCFKTKISSRFLNVSQLCLGPQQGF